MAVQLVAPPCESSGSSDRKKDTMIDARRDAALLAHKRKVDAERRQRAQDRAAQQNLRDLTPGVATPGSVKRAMTRRRMP